MLRKHVKKTHVSPRKKVDFYRRVRRMRKYLLEKVVPMTKRVAA